LRATPAGAALGTLGLTLGTEAQTGTAGPDRLQEIAAADRSWVQVAVAPDGRRFVNFSRWFGPLPLAVAEIRGDGGLLPYPDLAFSSGDASRDLRTRAVSVQSVVVGPGGRSLWIVDSGNPQLAGPVAGGAKLVEVDLATDKVVRTLVLGPDVAPSGSYLADVRIDAARGLAFLPDLAMGAIAVVDLDTGRGRRVLEGHPATAAEDMLLVFNGKPWLYPDGSRPRTAITSIAISPDGRDLYFKALVGRRLYCVSISALLGDSEASVRAVRHVADTHPSDAMNFGPDGWLYLTAVDRQAITRWRPGSMLETVVADPRLAWPVGLAFGPDGRGYVTVGRIHEGARPADRYRLFNFRTSRR
jgi:Major royal jelly protein